MVETNRRAWNRMVRKRHALTWPAEDAEFRDPLRAVDGCQWLGPSIRGWHVLCLAAGGGKHGPLYAAAGAVVTVVDISDAMLELDRQVAAERGLALRTIQSSMDQLSMLADREFDLVVQPVSTCYIRDVRPLYREVARVLRPGGLYISQHKQPTSLQTTLLPTPYGYCLQEPYYRSGPLPPAPPSRLREAGTQEFLHRWEELLGELCRSGFVIEDLIEPKHADSSAPTGSWGHRSLFVAPYVRIKARRVATVTGSSTGLIIPGS
ncbi:MAG: SAM-dependent methyltransferase [Pirellulaceae bacterium]|nr:MAG: SAM-dependent methyltransferase [Pirellulaceae bacterium]